MRKKLAIALTLLVSLIAHAQSREAMDDGAYIIDAAGRYVRFEGNDGVVVDYLFAPNSDEQIGWTVHVNDKLAFTINQAAYSESIAIDGLPQIESVYDFKSRTTSVLADGKSIAQLEYTPQGYFAAITIPGRFRWKASEPTASRRVRQTVEDASGRVISNPAVTAVSSDGIRSGEIYDVVADELGLNPHGLKAETSSNNSIKTVRDEHGRVAFYVINVYGGDIGYSPDGAALFYDIELSPMGVEIAPGSDLNVPKALAQRGTLPDHLILTARGAIGLYADESANNALSSVFMDADGKIHSTTVSVHK